MEQAGERGLGLEPMELVQGPSQNLAGQGGICRPGSQASFSLSPCSVSALLFTERVQGSTVTAPAVCAGYHCDSQEASSTAGFRTVLPRAPPYNHFFQWWGGGRMFLPGRPMDSLTRGRCPQPVSCRFTGGLPEDRHGHQPTWKPEQRP